MSWCIRDIRSQSSSLVVPDFKSRAAVQLPAMTMRPRVALLLLGVRDLTGGGGIERYFAGIFEQYRKRQGAFDLTLVTDVQSLARLQAVGHLCSREGVHLCEAGRNPIGLWRQTRCLWHLANSGRFDIVHIVLATPWYLPFVWLRRWWQRNGRPRLCVNLVDCTVAHSWFDAGLRRDTANRNAYWLYRLFLQTGRFDAIFTWYQIFRDRLGGRLVGDPLIVAGRYCCVDAERFKPAPTKRNNIVHVGRLVSQKRPLWFVEAVHHALSAAPERFEGWRFLMFGKGPLDADVRAAIARHGLSDRIELGHAGNLDRILGESKVFVSTQDFDNFSSMSMLEAMSAGNAIIARPVGQTEDWVRQGQNGLLLEEDTAEGLARALITCLGDESSLTTFGARSREIATREQCFDNVRRDLEAFWQATLEHPLAT